MRPGRELPLYSFLLPAALPALQAFYAVVRAADDIADNPELAPADKIAPASRPARAFTGSGPKAAGLPKAAALRASLAATGVGAGMRSTCSRHSPRTRPSSATGTGRMLGYCALSASPVGRQLLDLHGEPKVLYAFSDPLCMRCRC